MSLGKDHLAFESWTCLLRPSFETRPTGSGLGKSCSIEYRWGLGRVTLGDNCETELNGFYYRIVVQLKLARAYSFGIAILMYSEHELYKF